MNTLPHHLPLQIPAAWAYQRKTPMTEPSPSPPLPVTTPSLVLAGARACCLAMEVLRLSSDLDSPWTAALTALAYDVLRAHGITSLKQPEATKKPNTSPAAMPSDADDYASDPLETETETAAPDPTALLWPPPEPALPAVYTENYYLVREDCDARSEPDDFTHSLIPINTLPAVTLLTGEQLTFTGVARWHSEEHCWLMRLRSHDRMVWVLSRYIKPGDEIPAVAAP